MSEYVVVDKEQLESDLTIVADSIREKSGTTEDLAFPDGFVSAVHNIQNGGSEIIKPQNDDVTFYDYDGTVVATYTQDEIATFTELPTPPEHEGLTFQSWNWSLETIKARAKRTQVGALYDTSDGKTYIHVAFNDDKHLSPALNLVQTVAKGVLIDWGDGSEMETFDATNTHTYIPHTYPSTGDYIITLDCVDGTFYFESTENQTSGYKYDILTLPYRSYWGNNVYINCVREILLGSKCTAICCRSLNLEVVNMHENVTRADCLCGVECVHMSQKCTSVGGDKNANIITIPDGVTSLGGSCFSGCSSLTEITIPDGVTSLRDYCFQNCSSLTEITIPEGVTSLRDYCFRNCSSLTEITIPDGVTSLGNYCFQNCSSLTEITIPENVTSLGGNCFNGCSSLTEITIPENVTSLGGNCFNGCSSLTEITIPDGVTSLGGSCFNGCSSLTEITIPDGVTSLGGSCFYNCSEATIVTCLTPSAEFNNSCFAFQSNNNAQKRFYDFTNAILVDGVLSYTFGTNVFNFIKTGTIILFATEEIAEVAKVTTNLATYADYIHYVGEEGVEWF